MKILSQYLVLALICISMPFTSFAKENSSKIDIIKLDSEINKALKQNNAKKALELAIGKEKMANLPTMEMKTEEHIVDLKPENMSSPIMEVITTSGEGTALVLKITKTNNNIGKTMFVPVSFYCPNDKNTCYVYSPRKHEKNKDIYANIFSGPQVRVASRQLRTLARLVRKIPLTYDMLEGRKDINKIAFPNHENVELATQEDLNRLKKNNSNEL